MILPLKNQAVLIKGLLVASYIASLLVPFLQELCLKVMVFTLLTNVSVLLKCVKVKRTFKQNCVFLIFKFNQRVWVLCSALQTVSMLLFSLNVKQTEYLFTYCEVS